VRHAAARRVRIRLVSAEGAFDTATLSSPSKNTPAPNPAYPGMPPSKNPASRATVPVCPLAVHSRFDSAVWSSVPVPGV
jgi:hypothetical protein